MKIWRQWSSKEKYYMKVERLRCLHLENPLGTDRMPYFSWVLTSERENVVQKSFRIVVTDEDGETAWDSGSVNTDKSTFVVYEGKTLKSRTRYDWTVCVTDNYGEQDKASGWFETAFLNKEDWSAKWVRSPFETFEREAFFGQQPPAVMFRQEIELKKRVKKARMYATCHGVYRLTINGTRADDREFAPEYTVYRDYICYQTYDVTDLLNEGENVIGMHVGDGWYHGYMTKAQDADHDPNPAILTQLEVTYDDGSADTFVSDETVRVSESPVRHSDLFAGEKYDANLMPYGWDMPGFDESEWLEAGTCDFGYDRLHAQYGEPVKVVKILPVKEITISPKGERVIDFGQVIAGRVRIRVDLPKGKKVRISHTESLDGWGNFFDNNPTADQRVEFVSDGKAQTYEPYFTFMGFRYVMVDGIDDLKAEDICAVVLSSKKEDLGTFECSVPELNRLYLNTRWSQTANMISIPTDCPQREKAGWLGDIQVYTKTAMLNEDLTAFLTRWLDNVDCEQKDNGSVPFLSPLGGAIIGQYQMYEAQYQTPNAVAPAGWADAIVLVPYYMYQITGNTVILEEQYDAMKKWCDFVIKTARENHPADSSLPEEIDQYLWDTGFHYGEHLIPSYSKDGYGEKTFAAIAASTKYVAPIYQYFTLCCFAEIAELLGQTEDAAYYGTMRDKVKYAFEHGVIDAEGNMPADLMGAYAMPLYYGLVPETLKAGFVDSLNRKIDENGGCLDTGFLGTPILQDALCMNGGTKTAYDLLFMDREPSWLSQVKQGATTIWESWFSLDETGTPFVNEMMGMKFSISLNHYASGCVDDWMFRYINGIRSKAPGYKKIHIEPVMDERVTWAKRTYKSEYGRISTEWKVEKGMFTMTVEIPCNTSAEIVLPDGSRYDCGSGTRSYSCKL